MDSISYSVLNATFLSNMKQFLYTVTVLQSMASTVLDIGVTNKISFQFYYGPTVYDFTKIKYDHGLNILKQPGFNNSKNTIFYLHGYSERPADHIPGDSIDIIAAELLKRQDVNLIVVDYHYLVRHFLINLGPYTPDMFNLNRDGGYLNSVKNVPRIGKAMGRFFRQFIKNCQCQQRVHLIGFSLGAHVAHYIATALDKIDVKLQRITGLEPAAPFYEWNPLQQHLTKRDALFVDVVHSNAGQYGWSRPVGHVDYWPNRGFAVQPYCRVRADISAKCSHYCSVYYYAESINSQYFVTKKCANSILWANSLCPNDTSTEFGYNANHSIRGNYYFSTNANSPFAKGDAGLVINKFKFTILG